MTTKKKAAPKLNLNTFSRDFYKEDATGRTNADKHMATLTEAQLKKLIAIELADRKSPTILNRLHRRFTKLRAERERAMLLDSKVPVSL